MPWLILIPVLAFFFLKDAENFQRFALRLLPEGRIRWRGRDFIQEINQTLALYVRAQLIACVLIGITCWVGFALLGVPYALVLGVLAGLLEFVPLVGPVIIAMLGRVSGQHRVAVAGRRDGVVSGHPAFRAGLRGLSPAGLHRAWSCIRWRSS